MLEILEKKIRELQIKRESLRGENFNEYELHLHLEMYIELKKVDGALEVLKEILTEELLIEKLQKI